MSGSETWWTMKYGHKFTNLVVRVKPQKARSLSGILREIEREIKEVGAAIKKVESTAAGKRNKFLELR